jgi:HlyD family secretion protein
MMLHAPTDETTARRRALADELAGPALRSVRLSGLLALLLFAVLLAFAVFVPIAAGTVAQGLVAVDGERKVVQHSGGGIVADILVHEGVSVRQGDIVLKLNAVQAGAAAGVIDSQLGSLRAEEAVRTAEVTGRASVTFPPELLARSGDPKVAAILAAEQAAFVARRDLARSQADQLDQQLMQIDRSSASARSEKESQLAQAALLGEELASLRPLLEKGLAIRSRVLALERSLEAARGQAESLVAEEGRLAARAAETRGLRARIDVDRRAEAAEALRGLRARIAETLDRQLATSDTLQRTEVRAPIDGVVMALRVNTIGGVVEPGQPLMEIVPQDERLVARVRISPQDADNVRQGMFALVRFGAGSARAPAQAEGVVQAISADALADERTGASYFEVWVAIPVEEAARVPKDLVAPGLPVEVLIRSGEHTILSYLFSPIESAMFRMIRD